MLLQNNVRYRRSRKLATLHNTLTCLAPASRLTLCAWSDGNPRPRSQVRTNQIPRQIPDQSIYTRPLPCVLMGGILPFGCIFVQLFFILSSIW